MHPDPLSVIATSLYEMGECITSENPERIEQALTESDAIQCTGVRGYVREQGISIEAGLERLMDGLALRYFTAVMR